MMLSLEIRLVIILPTLLFFIGFVFKAVVERRSIIKTMEKKQYKELCYSSLRDFFFILAIDSTFLFIANGLILIFELERVVFGIMTMIIGVILSMFLLTGLHSRSNIGLVGNFGIFMLLTGEFAYFCFYGSPLENVLFGVGASIGFFLGVYMSRLAFPLKLKNIAKTESIESD